LPFGDELRDRVLYPSAKLVWIKRIDLCTIRPKRLDETSVTLIAFLWLQSDKVESIEVIRHYAKS
jgi:hypothetical protein